MAPTSKHSWENLNSIKRKFKKKKTEAKLKKLEKINSKKETVEEDKDKDSSTLSIAVPGSILDNAQSPELRTYLAGQIARAACIYQVDEIIVFNDAGEENNAYTTASVGKSNVRSCEQLATILQYLECPQYLRKHLFPIHNFLKYAGVLNPLDAPHHLRKDNEFQFREGVVLTLPPKPGRGSFVDIGLDKPVIVDKLLEPYCRVTVKLHHRENESKKRMRGVVVSPYTPKKKTGTYWGYTVRIAKSLNEVFTQSPFDKGYDLTIGTSDKGSSIDDLNLDGKLYTHCLIAFGGLNGLEYALENDNVLKVDDISLLFDFYVNVCPKQACRTIRTEEAVLISLAEFRTKLKKTIIEKL